MNIFIKNSWSGWTLNIFSLCCIQVHLQNQCVPLSSCSSVVKIIVKSEFDELVESCSSLQSQLNLDSPWLCGRVQMSGLVACGRFSDSGPGNVRVLSILTRKFTRSGYKKTMVHFILIDEKPFEVWPDDFASFCRNQFSWNLDLRSGLKQKQNCLSKETTGIEVFCLILTF